MSSTEVYRLVVNIAQLETNRLERHSAARRVVQDVSGMLLVQDAAVAGGHRDARQNALTTRRADAFVIRQIGTVEAERVGPSNVHSSSVEFSQQKVLQRCQVERCVAGVP